MSWGNRSQKPEARSQKAEWRIGFLFWLLASGFWLLSLPAVAQQRPLLTEDPRVIANGALVTETGFAYLRRARFPLSGLGGDEFQAFDAGLHFGLAPRVEFQMGGVFHNFLHIKENGSGNRNDWGDFSLSTKIKILDETPVLPVVSFRPTVVLPNSHDSKGIGTSSISFFASVFACTTVGVWFSCGAFSLEI